MLSETSVGFTALQNVTSLYVKCCLDPICEQRYKSQLVVTVQKQLVVFQKLQSIDPQPF